MPDFTIFEANDLNFSKKINIDTQENNPSPEAKHDNKKPISFSRQKRIINNKKNYSAFKSQYCNKVFGKYFEDPQKFKEFE